MSERTQVNEEYEGPKRETYITLTDPTLEEIKTIPVGADVIVGMPSGLISEWYWAQEMRDDTISYMEEGGSMVGHLFIWVNPDFLDYDKKKES